MGQCGGPPVAGCVRRGILPWCLVRRRVALGDGGQRSVGSQAVDTSAPDGAKGYRTFVTEVDIHLTADQIFAQWAIANLVHDHSINGGVYGYKTLGFKLQDPTTKLGPTSPVDSQVPPYAAQYATVDLPKDGSAFRIHFSAPATVPVISASGAPFWWSDRGDMVDTRLQRSVDLSHVHRATLHFRLWYDTEKDYDYGYVEASRDGGKTWQTLPGQHTTNTNPTGGSYGNGYTGHVSYTHRTPPTIDAVQMPVVAQP